MKDLVATSRALNLYYHHLHNIAHGPAFEGDHEMMAEFYAELEGSYDMLIERYMGLGGSNDKECLLHVVRGVQSVIMGVPEGNNMETHFNHALDLEEGFRSMLSVEMMTASKGTENLLAGLADQSEARVYKLNQRLK